MNFGVALLVARQLGGPKVKPGFWQTAAVGAIVAMPKTAMHENDLAQAGEGQVWFAGKLGGIKPVAEAHAMDQPPDDHLGLAAAIPHAGHALGALLGGEGVHGEKLDQGR